MSPKSFLKGAVAVAAFTFASLFMFKPAHAPSVDTADIVPDAPHQTAQNAPAEKEPSANKRFVFSTQGGLENYADLLAVMADSASVVINLVSESAGNEPFIPMSLVCECEKACDRIADIDTEASIAIPADYVGRLYIEKTAQKIKEYGGKEKVCPQRSALADDLYEEHVELIAKAGMQSRLIKKFADMRTAGEKLSKEEVKFCVGIVKEFVKNTDLMLQRGLPVDNVYRRSVVENMRKSPASFCPEERGAKKTKAPRTGRNP